MVAPDRRNRILTGSFNPALLAVEEKDENCCLRSEKKGKKISNFIKNDSIKHRVACLIKIFRNREKICNDYK